MTQVKWKQISICACGTALEWYDFALFASLITYISKNFFPTENTFASMMYTFSIFASGFILRPVGALFFGHLGDKFGRKKSLLITIVLMTLSTSAIGFVPTSFANVSVILLIVFRLAQGFAASGEYAGGITMLSELASNKSSLVASFGLFGVGFGIFVGAVVCSIVAMIVGDSVMLAWGWRIPFILGIPLGFIGFLFRRHVNESKLFETAQQKKVLCRIPFFTVVKKDFPRLLSLLGLFVIGDVGFYMNFVYLPSYFSTQLGGAHEHILLYLITATTLVFAISIPLSAFLADRVGKKTMMLLASTFMVLLAYPLFKWAVLGVNYQLLSQAVIAALLGMYLGPLPLVAAHHFSTNVRYSGIGVAINSSACIFGGSAPLICTWLANHSIAPAYYFILAASLGLAITLNLKERYIEL